MGKHLEQALPSVYALQCLTSKVDNNNRGEEFITTIFPASTDSKHILGVNSTGCMSCYS